jgi:hypothetical protein
LDAADAAAAAEAKAFDAAQAAKREVEAAVAAVAAQVKAKRKAEAAVLSQMNEVPMMQAGCCFENECNVVMVRFQWAVGWGGTEVFLAGTFSDWEELPVVRTRERVAVRDRGSGREGRGVSPCQTPSRPLRNFFTALNQSIAALTAPWTNARCPQERSPSGDFVLALSLEPGTYTYKYKVDGRWCTSHIEPQVTDEKNNVNNQVSQLSLAHSSPPFWVHILQREGMCVRPAPDQMPGTGSTRR